MGDTTIILNPGVGGDTTDATDSSTPTQVDPAPTPLKRERVVLGGDAPQVAFVPPLSAPETENPARQAVLDLLLKNTVYVVPTSDFALRSEIVPILQDIRDSLNELVRLQGGV